MDFLKRYRIDIVLFTLALVLRLLLLWINVAAVDGDFVAAIRGGDGYFEISRNLAEGNGFSADAEPPYRVYPLRTPGYIYAVAGILAATGSYGIVIALQVILGALIPLIGRRVAFALFPSEKLAVAVGIALALEPYLMLFSSILYTETLFIVLFLLFILIFFSYLERGSFGPLTASASVLGLATLTKTTCQYLPLLLIPFLLWHFRAWSWRIRLLHVGVFVGVFLIVLSPWIYHNYRAFGVAGLSSQPAYNLHNYLVPSILALEKGTSFESEVMARTTSDERAGIAITLVNSSLYQREALRVILAHPLGLMLSSGITVVTFFTHDGMLSVLNHAGYVAQERLGKPALMLLFSAPLELARAIRSYLGTPFILVLIVRLVWIGVTIAFLIGTYRALRQNPGDPRMLLMLVIIAYFVVTSIVGGLGVTARYRMPIEVFMFTYAFWTSSAVLGTLQNKKI